jgi:molybdopterin biosynthesis enzyme
VEAPQIAIPPAEFGDTDSEPEPAVGDGNDNDDGHDNDDSHDEDDGELPVAEPAKDWDLVSQHLSGTVTLHRLPADAPRNMVSIGDWARNRGTLIQEKTVLRPPEVAMLLSLGVEYVDVYRRPVMGVASLGMPFPTAGHAGEKQPGESTCPVASLATYLARSARVAALPLGFAPQRFHHLVRAVKHWVSQVDILVLVGGSHHGVRCCGLDVLDAAGSVDLSGVEMEPGGCLSVGKVQGKPVVVLPGALPDVLAGFVLIARPMAHKYLTPYLYADQLSVALTHGSQLNVEVDTAVPVRISFDEGLGKHVTHYQGRPRDPWLDYTRGQALVLLEAGRSYADDEVVTAYRY